MKRVGLLFLFIGAFWAVRGQSTFYDLDSIREIKIYFSQPNWDHILDSLYVDGEEERMLCSLTIDGVPYDSVGIRYKGFSSVSTNRVKNPFNIKLDYVHGNQSHQGIEKIKLSNVIQDPSFVREVLAYEIGRKYLPSSEANFARVFINDTYWGLYTNVESVNKRFLAQHFGSTNNAFFKGNPQSLDLTGENSNLAKSWGTAPSGYEPYYDLKSDAGWDELYELIDELDQNPTTISQFLNIDRTLWMHAFNYSLVNFDSYIGYAQNYYIYKDDNQRWNPILWDLNQSFGSFRLADASDFWDGFNIAEAKTIDPLQHFNSVSVFPRPLMRNLFDDERHRKMYIAHLRTIVEENFSNMDYAMRAQYMQTLVDSDVAADVNKFYTYQDFLDNLTITVFDLADYPGITELIDDRTTYLSAYPGFQGAPVINAPSFSPTSISVGDQIWITSEVTNASEVFLSYRFGGNGLFTTVSMLDDGTQQDGAAGDNVYGRSISGIGNNVQYYIYAENDSAGRFSPERAAYEFHSIVSSINPQNVVINELMASNESFVKDEFKENEDWIELYNNTAFEISGAGLYLSDDLTNLKKWALPDVIIEGDGYMVIWADEDTDQGMFHANFKLSAAGEQLILSSENGTIIDSLTFPPQNRDVTWGRLPNGTGPFQELGPTIRFTNNSTGIEDLLKEERFKVFPNPSSGQLFVEMMDQREGQIEIRSLTGALLKNESFSNETSLIQFDLDELPAGVYFIHLHEQSQTSTQKFIITP